MVYDSEQPIDAPVNPAEPSPRVTAMMLVRDRADLLAPAARSVLAQTFTDLELVILDDGSHDDTWQVAQELAAADGRVRLLRNEVSTGIPAARNQVLAEARGEYVAICDSDDLSRPDRFARQVALLTIRPQLAAVGARINAFSGDAPADGAEPDWHWGLRDGRLPFAFPSAMLRTEAVREVGGFDETWPIAEDLQLAYRLAAAASLPRDAVHPFATVDAVLVDYRIHGGSITAGRALLREWCTLRAQIVGLRCLRGRFTPRGYAVVMQSAIRCVLAAVGLRR